MRELLAVKTVVIHPIVIGELMVGNLNQRHHRFIDLSDLRKAIECEFDECMAFIETHKLYGIGLAWNDVQLLCSAKEGQHNLWTFDKTLDRAARHLGIAYASVH